MLENIIYPIITTAITAVIGFFLSIFGFNFKELFSSYSSDPYLKERFFVLCAIVVILLVLFFDLFRNKLKNAKEKLEQTEQALSQKETDLLETKNNLKITKKALDDLYKKEQKLHAYSALVNYKEDN